ncbi:MAG: CHRD domain-containing protein [Phormidesmis sp. CAN_BIN44]|nr:CHRD domain-containing protein [Phormidesmis sp. CAN_BIN44]
MRRSLTVTALSSALVASASLAAQAASVNFSGPLSGAQEAPTSNASPATGSYVATLVGEPEQWTFNYKVSFQNLTGSLRDGHIHLGSRGAAGPVVHSLDGIAAVVETNVTSGSLVGDWTSADLPATLAPATVFQRFLDGQYYFNVHSTIFPGGEIRGQIDNPTASVAVPEPATAIGLLVAGVLGAVARRKQVSQVT